MKTAKVFFALTIAGASMVSCHSGMNNENTVGRSAEPAAAKASEQSDLAADAKEINNDQRKVIKKADIRSRVKDVLATTTQLERVTRQIDGIVMSSHLENTEEMSYTRAFSEDSLKQIQSYVPSATLTLKIPVQHLDTFLNVLVSQSEFINSRNLALEDMTLQYLSNELKQEASKAGNLPTKSVTNVDYIDQKTEQNINRKIENLSINDQVKYATLTVDLYEPKKVLISLVPNVDNMVAPRFGEQMKSALYNGWYLVKYLLIGLTNLWVFILVGGIALLLVRKYRKTGLITKS